jgi:hypothetical protein
MLIINPESGSGTEISGSDNNRLRDNMSVSRDFQQFKQRAGLDRHVIPKGFLIATVLFSTDISSLRDFLAAHDKSRRDDTLLTVCSSLRQGYMRDLLYEAGESSMVF